MRIDHHIHGIRHARCFVLLLFCLLLTACVSSPFYHPDRVSYSTPAEAGLPFERVSFVSRDGTSLSGWFIPAVGVADSRAAKGTVVHFHGNAQNMTAHWRFVGWLPAQGYNVFVFDYRGYGLSQGSPEPKGVFDDANAALDYVRTRKDVDPERLLVLGQSLGGTNAIAAVGAGNRAGIRAMVIEATFSSYSAIANDKVAGSGALVDDSYSADRYIGKLAPIPLLLIHGTQDQIIPYGHSTTLFALAQEPKTMITVEGGRHIDAFSLRHGNRYQTAVLDFYAAALAAAPAR
ncbi:alpha/beta hydrolase [Chitinilyticum aquatile]|uniref:alpha/beta hydrolase n=1 Tax=Chitinilyticum aquatile TaxID=362520 RepID=UPI0006864356|nr:alpha/beta hydrolase [Chitinilyticum aquatile]